MLSKNAFIIYSIKPRIWSRLFKHNRQAVHTRSSAIVVEPHDALSVEILSTAVQRIAVQKAATGEWPWKSLNATGNGAIWQAIYHLMCCTNVVYLAPFPRYDHFYSVCATACDLQKSTSFVSRSKLGFKFQLWYKTNFHTSENTAHFRF